MAECSYRSISLTWGQATYEAMLVFFLKRVNTWERSEFLLLPVYGEVCSSRDLPKDVCHGLLHNVDRRVSNSRPTNKNLATWMLISKEELNKLSWSRTTEYCIRPTEILIPTCARQGKFSETPVPVKDSWRQNVRRARPCWWSEVQKCPCRQMYVEDTRAHTPGCAPGYS